LVEAFEKQASLVKIDSLSAFAMKFKQHSPATLFLIP